MTEKVNNIKKTHRGKADTTKNSDGLQEKIEEIKKETLFPLRVNKQTVIFVTKDKCNEEYAEFYRKNRIEGNREAVYVNALTPALDKINKEELQKMYSAKRSTKQMAEHFGVSLYSINTFIHQNNMVR